MMAAVRSVNKAKDERRCERNEKQEDLNLLREIPAL
jgi:hypothetical protein